MHCFTLTEAGPVEGINVSRRMGGEGNDKEEAGIAIGDFFMPFHPELSEEYLNFVSRWKPQREVIHHLDFDGNNQPIAADPKEKSDYALALVDVQKAPGGRVEVTASVKEEYFDEQGLVQRRYRNIGDTKGVRIFYPLQTFEGVDISTVMEAASCGDLEQLWKMGETEAQAREENLKLLSTWAHPMMLVMLPGGTFRVFRTGRLEGGPKIFSFRWLWRRHWRRAQQPKMVWDVHEPKGMQ
jgi:hypothetical protein